MCRYNIYMCPCLEQHRGWHRLLFLSSAQSLKGSTNTPAKPELQILAGENVNI